MIEAHQKILSNLKDAMTDSLSALVSHVISDAASAIDTESRGFKDSQKLLEAKDSIVAKFSHLLGAAFDRLLGTQPETEVSPNYGGLSLMEEDELESVIAMEGMIAHARNCDITEYLRFTTRLNALYYADLIDESNNPLDPAQIGEAFKLAVQPIGLSAAALLALYRSFNRGVFHNLESILGEANDVLRQEGIIPSLAIDGRSKKDIRTKRGNSRQITDPNERAFRVTESSSGVRHSASQEGFTLLQSLIHDDGHKETTASQLHDAIAITDLFYQAIWDDETVPLPIRNLLARTPLTCLKIIIADQGFWENPEHPVRRFLNEVGEARMSSTLLHQIEQDPLFRKAKDTIGTLVTRYRDDQKLIASLLDEYLDFKQHQVLGPEESQLSQSEAAQGSQKRLEAAGAYASHRIAERMKGHVVPAVVRDFLDNQFRDFLVEVLLTQGPGGDNWKPIMNTIDTLLWSVQPDKNKDDMEQLAQVNKRLMSNLGKALRVARVERQHRGNLLRQLEAAQQESFGKSAERLEELDQSTEQLDEPAELSATGVDSMELAEDDLYWQEVDKYPLGVWMEFDVDSAHTIRCTLAARIESIDEYIFVNRQGVKVVGKSRAGLAQEVRDGTARLIYDSPLTNRAIDTVIARLRARQGDPRQRR